MLAGMPPGPPQPGAMPPQPGAPPMGGAPGGQPPLIPSQLQGGAGAGGASPMGGGPMQLAQQAAGQMAGGQKPDLSQLVSHLAQMMVQLLQDPKSTQMLVAKDLMETFRKWHKAENTVPAMVPKMDATQPFQPPMGRADQMAASQMAGQAAAGAPPAALLQQLAAAKGGM